MRLFLSADAVRQTRIVLLRATHLPFVALIWMYESSRQTRSRRQSQLPPNIAGRNDSPNSTRIAPRDGPLHSGRHSSGFGKRRSQSRPHSGVRKSIPEAGLDIKDVINEMEHLRIQMERVAASIEALRREPEAQERQ